MQVLGGGLNHVFGFRDAVASRQRYDLTLATADPLLADLTDPREQRRGSVSVTRYRGDGNLWLHRRVGSACAFR